MRRADWEFSIDYSDDIDHAMKVVRETIEADPRTHKDPEVFTAVSAHADSSVTILARAWVDAGDFWGLKWDMMRNVKYAFDQNGISIPYPHQVNMTRED